MWGGLTERERRKRRAQSSGTRGAVSRSRASAILIGRAGAGPGVSPGGHGTLTDPDSTTNVPTPRVRTMSGSEAACRCKRFRRYSGTRVSLRRTASTTTPPRCRLWTTSTDSNAQCFSELFGPLMTGQRLRPSQGLSDVRSVAAMPRRLSSMRGFVSARCCNWNSTTFSSGPRTSLPARSRWPTTTRWCAPVPAGTRSVPTSAAA